MSFRSEKRPSRDNCVTLRLTEEQNEMLDQLAAQLNLSKGELLRTALDYWLENSPDAKQAMRALRGK